MSDSSTPWVEPDRLPPATLYDPLDDQETPLGGDPTGTVVLLLVGEADRRWAGETAMALSTAWARHGRRIVLADLHLENPVLHELVGGDNLEGVVDVFLYGASIARSARPVRGRGFYLIPAGTYTPDLDAIYGHPRWPKLVAGFRDANASLVLFGAAEAVNTDAIAAWVSEVILLGRPATDAVLAPLRAAGVVPRALIVQPSLQPAPVRDVAPPPPPPDVAPPPALAQPDAALPPPAAEPAREPARTLVPDHPPETALHLPPPPVRTAAPRRGATFALWLVLAAVVVAAIGFVVGQLRPDLFPWLESGSPAAAGDPVASPVAALPPEPAAPERLGEPLPYSVQTIAFQSLQPARDRLTADRARLEGVPLFISPEEIQGILYYKILAGALPDSTRARQLKERLVEAGVVAEEDAAGSWTLLQNTPLAFDLGERPGPAEAAAATDSLLTRQIPAYAVPVLYSDSTRRWQLYAGAYRDSTSAGAMRELLASAGLAPPLVTRTGVAPEEAP